MNGASALFKLQESAFSLAWQWGVVRSPFTGNKNHATFSDHQKTLTTITCSALHTVDDASLRTEQTMNDERLRRFKVPSPFFLSPLYKPL